MIKFNIKKASDYKKRAGYLCISLLFLTPFGCKDDNVVTRIGDNYIITKEDFQRALEKLPVKKRKRKKDRSRALDTLIQAKIFSDEARKAGLDKNPDIMAEMDRTRDEVLAISFITNHVDKKAAPSVDTLREYYNKNRKQFNVPESVSIQHFIYSKKVKTEIALKKLKKGKSFEWLAKRGSLCSCWEKDGFHGKLYKGRVEPELDKIFSMKKGAISGVIRTKKGYQVIKVLDKTKERVLSFREAMVGLSKRLYNVNKAEILQAYYKKTEIDYHPKEKGIFITVGNEKIPEKSVAPMIKGSAGEERKNLIKKWKRYFVNIKLYSREAKKAGMENDKVVQKELEHRLNQILANAFYRKYISGKNKITDRMVKDYYQSHMENFRNPAKWRVKIIQTRSLEEAMEIHKNLKEGASFVQLAMEKSIHPSAKRRGAELGWFGKGTHDPKLENAAFALKKGEISDVIKTGSGYQILKLMDKIVKSFRPFENEKGRIQMRLLMEGKEKIKLSYYKKADVKIYSF